MESFRSQAAQAARAASGQKVDNFQRVIDSADPPPPPAPEDPGMKGKIKAFCLSRLGVSLISFVVFFVLLLLVRPVFIFQRPREGDDPTVKRVNYWVVFGIAVIGALLTYFIPALLMNKQPPE